MAVTVVTPVFRDAENVPFLARSLAAALQGTDWDLLVVDDDSGDGVGAAVCALRREGLPVSLRVRQAGVRDLSRSVLLGLAEARADEVVVMDVDGSHPAAAAPVLLAALGSGVLVLGSRYAAGGQVAPAWGTARRCVSGLATLLARPLTGGCRDPLSGFFALRRSSLGDLGRFRPVGYKIALELMVKGGLSVREVPFRFEPRRAGASKMGLRQCWQYLQHVVGLYVFCLWQGRFRSFVAAGVVVGAVSFAGYVGFQRLGLDHRLAQVLALVLALSCKWVLHRFVVFSDRVRGSSHGYAVRFVPAVVFGLVMSAGSYALLAGLGPGRLFRFFCLGFSMVVGSAVNYVVSSRYVWKGEKE